MQGVFAVRDAKRPCDYLVGDCLPPRDKFPTDPEVLDSRERMDFQTREEVAGRSQAIWKSKNFTQVGFEGVCELGS